VEKDKVRGNIIFSGSCKIKKKIKIREIERRG
jgi:hypothetical protein